MRNCPSCGADLSESKRLVRASTRDLVESLQLDAAKVTWCLQRAPEFDPHVELENFKIRMRANGYKVGRNAVKDAWAAFQYHMNNAVKFGFPVKKKPQQFDRAKRKDE